MTGDSGYQAPHGRSVRRTRRSAFWGDGADALSAPALNRGQVVSWCLFDFANSSYSAVIAAVVFQVYYINAIVGNEKGRGDLWWGRAISASMLVVSITSPFVGGIADHAGLRKRLLAAYTATCVAAVAGFTLLEPGAYLTGFLLIVVANLGMEGGLVFYNSFLPQIAPPHYQGRVSGWGFGVGYAGSILSLLIALPLAKAGRFDAIWVMVALFFAICSVSTPQRASPPWRASPCWNRGPPSPVFC